MNIRPLLLALALSSLSALGQRLELTLDQAIAHALEHNAQIRVQSLHKVALSNFFCI